MFQHSPDIFSLLSVLNIPPSVPVIVETPFKNVFVGKETVFAGRSIYGKYMVELLSPLDRGNYWQSQPHELTIMDGALDLIGTRVVDHCEFNHYSSFVIYEADCLVRLKYIFRRKRQNGENAAIQDYIRTYIRDFPDESHFTIGDLGKLMELITPQEEELNQTEKTEEGHETLIKHRLSDDQLIHSIMFQSLQEWPQSREVINKLNLTRDHIERVIVSNRMRPDLSPYFLVSFRKGEHKLACSAAGFDRDMRICYVDPHQSFQDFVNKWISEISIIEGKINRFTSLTQVGEKCYTLTSHEDKTASSSVKKYEYNEEEFRMVRGGRGAAIEDSWDLYYREKDKKDDEFRAIFA